MRIAVIHPKTIYRCENTLIQSYVNHWCKDVLTRSFNHNLFRLEALTPLNYEVVLVDENYEEIPFKDTFDVVAITAMTYQVERAYEIIRKFKEGSSCYGILGGIHASVLPQEALNYFDSVCVGEVENIWAEYLNDVSLCQVKKIYYGSLADLEKEKTLNYSLIKKWVHPQKFYFFPTTTARGCPRGCDYCSATYLFKKKYRKKEINQVLLEIKEIKKITQEMNLQSYRIEFCDDNFVIDRQRTRALLNLLKKETISYVASLDIAASDDLEILELLNESGCKLVSIGLESLEINILEDLGQWKKNQRKKVEKNIQAFFDYAIMPSVNFIVGSDGTNNKVFHNIRNFLKEFPVPYNLSFFTPFPGTPYFESLKKQKRLREDKSWADYNLLNMVFKPEGMSIDELYEEFYSVRSTYNHRERYFACLGSLNKKKIGVNFDSWIMKDSLVS